MNVIKNSVEGLVNLLLESCRYKVIQISREEKVAPHFIDITKVFSVEFQWYFLQLCAEDFRDSVIALGFAEDQETILSKLYNVKKDEILDSLTNIGFKLPEYHDMEWRFEVQVLTILLLC